MIEPAPQRSPAKAPRPARPMPGNGTRLTAYDAIGFAIGAPRGGSSFGHPWKPFLGGSRLQFTPGMIMSAALRVPGIKVGGRLVRLDAETAPALVLTPDKANADGESFAVIEVEPNDAGDITPESRVEIVHREVGGASLNPLIGRKAIALILWQERRPLRAIPLVHFHLEYERVDPTPGGGAVHHYFR